MAKPIDEEAHFRIDEMERKFATIPPMDSIQAAFTGMLAMALEEMRRVVEKGTATQPTAAVADIQADKELTVAVRELIACLKGPNSRTVIAQLPSGPVSMTINETRN
jgi:hypothetical protein